MRKFAALLACLVIVAACSGGGNSLPQPPPRNSATTQTVTVALPANGITQTLPSLDGVSTSLTVPANTAASGTTLSISVSSSAIVGMHSIPAPKPEAFVYYTITSSNDVTLNGIPAFRVTLPSPPHDQGQFYAWAYNTTLGWTDWGTVNVSGSMITFGGAPKATLLQKGAQLIIVPFTAIAGASCGTPSPSPSPSPTPIAVLTPSPVQTFSPSSVPHYRFVPLPADFAPFEINDNGVIAGYTQDIATAAVKAALYEHGQLRFLGALPGDAQSEALGINNKDQAVGMSISPSFSHEAVLYSGGHVYDLHEPGTAVAINNKDLIAGFVFKGHQMVVLFDAGTCTPILFPFSEPGSFSIVRRINDAGQYVGEFDVAQTYVGSGMAIHPLGLIGVAGDINNHGDIIGYTTEPLMPFIRNGVTGAITVPVLPGFFSGDARAINDSGQVVGNSYGNKQTGFLYQAGKIVSLDQISGKPMLSPVDINNRGEIIVFDNANLPENAPFPAAGVLEPIAGSSR